MGSAARVGWIDASAGVAGDMLLGALVDAGASLAVAQAAVDAVIPAGVRLVASEVARAGLRATKVDVETLREDHPHRSWRTIQELLRQAELDEPVRAAALAVFTRLARAEGRVHGVPAEEVHFHEVGAWDSIADVVGVCAALHELGVTRLTAGPVALGSGRARAAHGDIPVPVPAVLELATGWRVLAGGSGTGELATPTGVALVTALAAECGELPPLLLETVGVGAGTRDTPGRPNVVRVVIGRADASTAVATAVATEVVLEANVDDLDPRLWPGVLSALLEAGASDAWLAPILMKKGRPAHTLHVLAPRERVAALREVVFQQTSTIGVREATVSKVALERSWVRCSVLGDEQLPVKVAHRDGVVVRATPEFEDVAALAARRGLPVGTVLTAAVAAAVARGLVPGAALPADHGERG